MTQVGVKVGTTSYQTCHNVDTDKCKVSLLTSKITTIAVVNSKLEVSGDALIIANYDITATFGGAKTTLDSSVATKLVFSFANGLPLGIDLPLIITYTL